MISNKKIKHNIELSEELTVYKNWYDPSSNEPSKEAKDGLYRDLSLLYLKQAITTNSLYAYHMTNNPYGLTYLPINSHNLHLL